MAAKGIEDVCLNEKKCTKTEFLKQANVILAEAITVLSVIKVLKNTK